MQVIIKKSPIIQRTTETTTSMRNTIKWHKQWHKLDTEIIIKMWTITNYHETKILKFDKVKKLLNENYIMGEPRWRRR